MADHVRQQLVAATKTRLTGLVTTASRVFGFRVNPLQPAELPCLCVYSMGDAAQPLTIHSPIAYEREVDLHVVGYAAHNDTLDATLDQITFEVEEALGIPLTVDTKSIQLVYQGCAKTMDAGETQAGEIDITFKAQLANDGPTPGALS